MSTQQLNENTPVPLKLASIILVSVMSTVVPLAVGWTLLSSELESAKADIATVKVERSEALKVWQQDRINEAAFQSKVMTKLDNIESKLGR